MYGLTALEIAFIVFVLVGIWALVEVVLTLKQARKSVKTVSDNLNTTLEELQPVIAKVDGMIDDVQPSIKQLEPLAERANLALDAATVNLVSLDSILTNVSKVTSAASGVTDVATKVAEVAVGAGTGILGKVTTKVFKEHAHPLLELASSDDSVQSQASTHSAIKGDEHKTEYVTCSSDADSSSEQ